MITKSDLANLKEGSRVSRKIGSKVLTYVVTYRTRGGEHFWVRQERFHKDSFYDENYDLTTPSWSIHALKNEEGA